MVIFWCVDFILFAFVLVCFVLVWLSVLLLVWCVGFGFGFVARFCWVWFSLGYWFLIWFGYILVDWFCFGSDLVLVLIWFWISLV